METTNRTVRAAMGVLTLAAALGVTACETAPGPICTLEAVASVVLDIGDATGAPFPNATIDVQTQTLPPFTLDCGGNCTSVVLVYEVAGLIRYTVSAPGYVTVTGTVNVPRDSTGCHVVTQNRTVIMRVDDTIGALSGAWSYTNFVGQSTILRFGPDGRIIGAVLTNRVNTGDHNLYIAYNGNQIAGVPGQTVRQATAVQPTRNGNVFHWSVTTLGYPVGFENATMSSDFRALSGTLLNDPVMFTRLDSIPPALR